MRASELEVESAWAAASKATRTDGRGRNRCFDCADHFLVHQEQVISGSAKSKPSRNQDRLLGSRASTSQTVFCPKNEVRFEVRAVEACAHHVGGIPDRPSTAMTVFWHVKKGAIRGPRSRSHQDARVTPGAPGLRLRARRLGPTNGMRFVVREVEAASVPIVPPSEQSSTAHSSSPCNWRRHAIDPACTPQLVVAVLPATSPHCWRLVCAANSPRCACGL